MRPIVKVAVVVVLALGLSACPTSPVRAPKGVLEQVEIAELTAQQLSTSVTNLTCTKFEKKQCVEPGRSFMPDKALVYHDMLQRARGGLKATVAIGSGQIGDCLGTQRTQQACLASAQAILAEVERAVLEQQAKGTGAQ